MDNAQKFALKKYPVKVIKKDVSLDINASRRKQCEKIYRDIENDIMGRVEEWLRDRINIPCEVETTADGEPMADSYIKYATERLETANRIISELRDYIKGE